VTIASLMPGPTDTNFFERAAMLDTRLDAGHKDDPADDGFETLMAGDERVESASLKTKLQGRTSPLMPDGVQAQMHRIMAKPDSSDK
jgi:short-subunit dehydrogenase